ncbi:MAG: hypothetical protein JO036_15710 [Candidatus Eremiobacteraeota bacterium]|nr:hypothetical protein [Candidatus Eremiobacteraeota bacterium]
MSIKTKLFQAISAEAAHPQVTVDVPAGFKIIGGGALDNWGSGVGNMLTAAYPQGPNAWFVAGKDHEQSSPATIIGFAIAIHDPNDEWDVTIQSESGGPDPHPSATATLPDGYHLTGGGASVNWTGAGNLLTASFPSGDLTWEARSKDHDVPDPAVITAYAIGIRHRGGHVNLKRTVQPVTGDNDQHPTATACLSSEWTLSGGGALDNWNGDGNLLTASFPQGKCWSVAGKDHIHPSPATVTAFAIGIRQI